MYTYMHVSKPNSINHTIANRYKVERLKKKKKLKSEKKKKRTNKTKEKTGKNRDFLPH